MNGHLPEWLVRFVILGALSVIGYETWHNGKALSEVKARVAIIQAVVLPSQRAEVKP